jgi:hypothetical protein
MYYISPGPVFREECDGAYHIWKIGVLYIVGDPFFEENAMALTIFGIRQPFFRSGCIIHRSDPFFEENVMVQIFASFLLCFFRGRLTCDVWPSVFTHLLGYFEMSTATKHSDRLQVLVFAKDKKMPLFASILSKGSILCFPLGMKMKNHST